MTGHVRVALIVAGLGAWVAVPFVLWGDGFEAAWSTQRTVAWLREQGPWAWLAAIALLITDLVLPIPGSSVMAALGIVYGPLLGGAVAAAGSMLSGLVAYGLCRAFGQRPFRWMAGPETVAAADATFRRQGGWLVALSRWVPVLPETIACLAGLARMRLRTFVLALACGSIPLGFAFAAVGHLGAERPVLTLMASALAPALLWAAVRVVARRPASPPGATR